MPPNVTAREDISLDMMAGTDDTISHRDDASPTHSRTSSVSFRNVTDFSGSVHPDLVIDFPRMGNDHDDTDEQSPNFLQQSYRRINFCRGDMQEYKSFIAKQHLVIRILDSWARGIGQVVFANNPISGILITVGIMLSSLYSGVYMLLGALASTMTAFALGLHSTMVKDGIYGFNGALVGIAVPLFHFGGIDDDWNAIRYVGVAVVLLSCVSALVTEALAQCLVPSSLSPLTAPFNLVTWMWLLCVAGNSSFFPLNGSMLQPTLQVQPLNSSQAPKLLAQDYDATELVLAALFKGASQVYLQEHVVAGVLILSGMLVHSEVAFVAALAGSVIGTCTAMAIGVPLGGIEAGLWSYNSLLVMVALVTIFYPKNKVISWVLAFVAAALGALLTGALSSLFKPVALPALTFPFVIVTWVFILSGKGIDSLLDHRERTRKRRRTRLSTTFQHIRGGQRRFRGGSPGGRRKGPLSWIKKKHKSRMEIVPV